MQTQRYQINVTLPPKLCQAIKQIAYKKSYHLGSRISPTELVRVAVEHYWGKEIALEMAQHPLDCVKMPPDASEGQT